MPYDHMIQENISLQPYNTFGIDARARYLAPFDTVDAIEEALRFSQRQGITGQLTLGGGSNILLTGDIDGLVLKNEITGITIVHQDADHVYVRAGAGENWHRFVLHCIEQGFAGIENLSLIPGNVGASPMQNIGAYGVEIKDVFHELQAYHVRDRVVEKFTAEDCAFGYRDSVFKNKYRDQFIILDVTYRLNKKPVFNTSYGAIAQELEKMQVQELTIRAVSDAVIRIRSSKLPDPKETGNAGSFFKNPVVAEQQFDDLKTRYPEMPSFRAEGGVKIPAGWLIEQCGWKGYRKGDAGCYPKQALVLVNYGHASGREILQLSNDIIASVQQRFGITLEREVNVI
ncbi:MAG TPA: UDP-N-acetylmuramate dehydrogenase [Flavisolibacter sp.]